MEFRLDGHHANVNGEYLGAAVWFEFFFDADVRNNAFKPGGAAAEDVAFLKKIAHQVTTSEESLRVPEVK